MVSVDIFIKKEWCAKLALISSTLECGFQYELLGVLIKFYIQVQQKFMMLKTSALDTTNLTISNWQKPRKKNLLYCCCGIYQPVQNLFL